MADSLSNMSQRWVIYVDRRGHAQRLAGMLGTIAGEHAVVVMPVVEHEAEIARIHAEYTLIPKHAQAGESIPLDEWCPVCHTYHTDPGEKTDAGRLTRPCPLLPPGVGANHPINTEP